VVGVPYIALAKAFNGGAPQAADQLITALLFPISTTFSHHRERSAQILCDSQYELPDDRIGSQSPYLMEPAPAT
jgi:hypothetical protein